MHCELRWYISRSGEWLCECVLVLRRKWRDARGTCGGKWGIWITAAPGEGRNNCNLLQITQIYTMCGTENISKTYFCFVLLIKMFNKSVYSFPNVLPWNVDLIWRLFRCNRVFGLTSPKSNRNLLDILSFKSMIMIVPIPSPVLLWQWYCWWW